MELYEVVLFLHISVLLCAIALAGILHASEWQVPSASTVAELRVITRPQKWGMLFAPIVVLLLLLGMWLVSLSKDHGTKFSLSDGWIWSAVVALVILFVTGAGIMGRHADHQAKVLATTPDGPVTPELNALATATVPWVVGHADTFLAIAVVFNMVNKPSTLGSVVVLLAGLVSGGLLGLLGSRRARV